MPSRRERKNLRAAEKIPARARKIKTHDPVLQNVVRKDKNAVRVDSIMDRVISYDDPVFNSHDPENKILDQNITIHARVY